MKSDEELADWFKERLVWDNQETVIEMLKNGLFIRAYEPQVRRHILVRLQMLQAKGRWLGAMSFIQIIS